MPKIIKLSGIVGWNILAKELEKKLVEDDVNVLKIDSEGGSVFEGNRLFNVIKDHLKKFPGTIKIELGVLAASAASYFPLAAGVKNISVRTNTTLMGHKSWGVSWGNADDMTRDAGILNGLDKIFARIYSKFTGKSVDDTLLDMKNEFWLIGGQAVIDAGFASGIVEGEESDNDNETLDKSEVRAKIEDAKNKLREIGQKEDLTKWAARIQTELNTIDVTPLGQKLLFNEKSIPATGGNKILKDTKMTLSEFLESNPEAKAVYDKDITAAKSAGIEEGQKATVKEALKVDRERSAKILVLAGAAVPAKIAEAVNSGMTSGEFSEAELTSQNEARKALKPEDTNLGVLKPDNQLPENGATVPGNTPKGASKEQTAELSAWDKLYEKEGK